MGTSEGGKREDELGAGAIHSDVLSTAIQQESPEAYGCGAVPWDKDAGPKVEKGHGSIKRMKELEARLKAASSSGD